MVYRIRTDGHNAIHVRRLFSWACQVYLQSHDQWADAAARNSYHDTPLWCLGRPDDEQNSEVQVECLNDHSGCRNASIIYAYAQCMKWFLPTLSPLMIEFVVISHLMILIVSDTDGFVCFHWYKTFSKSRLKPHRALSTSVSQRETSSSTFREHGGVEGRV